MALNMNEMLKRINYSAFVTQLFVVKKSKCKYDEYEHKPIRFEKRP